MIVQRVPAGVTPVFIRNVDHARAAGQLALAFGNDLFCPPEPVDLTCFVVEHHEEGWRSIDETPLRNPATGLPYHLGETPPDLLIQKSIAAPDFNARHHPWCGLLSSMHSWGLYNNRYGFSDAVSIDSRPESHAAAIARMLDGEIARQMGLKTHLAGATRTAPWIAEDNLVAAYKLMEFCDTLALWWQMTHHSLRQTARFSHVPTGDGHDLTVEVTPTGPCSARIAPYPFARPAVSVRCEVRAMAPAASDGAFTAALADAPFQEEHFVFTARPVPTLPQEPGGASC